MFLQHILPISGNRYQVDIYKPSS